MAIKAAIIRTFLGFSSVKFYVPSDTSIEYNITHYSCDNLHTNSNNTIINGVFLLDLFSIHHPKIFGLICPYWHISGKVWQKYFRKEILGSGIVLILLFFIFGHFSTLGGNKTERLNLKKSSSFHELRGNILKVKLCHIFLCNKIVSWWIYFSISWPWCRGLCSVGICMTRRLQRQKLFLKRVNAVKCIGCLLYLNYWVSSLKAK